MLIDFNKKLFHCVRYEFLLPLECFYLLNYTRSGARQPMSPQDQNQGRPRATRTHCGRIG